MHNVVWPGTPRAILPTQDMGVLCSNATSVPHSWPQSNHVAHGRRLQPIGQSKSQILSHEGSIPQTQQTLSQRTQKTRMVSAISPNGAPNLHGLLHHPSAVESIEVELQRPGGEYSSADIVELLCQQSENVAPSDEVIQKTMEWNNNARAATNAYLEVLMNIANQYREETAKLEKEIAERKVLATEDTNLPPKADQ